MERVAIYLRSPLKDNVGWIENQLAELEKYATVNGGTVVDTYIDEGFGGRGIYSRPSLKKMLLDCKKGKVDEVLILTRRNFAIEASAYLKVFVKLKKDGVSLISMDYGKIDLMKDLSDLLYVATLRGY